MQFKVIVKLRDFFDFFHRLLHKPFEDFAFITRRSDKEAFAIFHQAKSEEYVEHGKNNPYVNIETSLKRFFKPSSSVAKIVQCDGRDRL